MTSPRFVYRFLYFEFDLCAWYAFFIRQGGYDSFAFYFFKKFHCEHLRHYHTAARMSNAVELWRKSGANVARFFPDFVRQCSRKEWLYVK